MNFSFYEKENMPSLFPIENQQDEAKKWFTEERTDIERQLKRPLNFEDRQKLKMFAETFVTMDCDHIYSFDRAYSDWLDDLGIEY